ncbi:MAG: hypothetical protein ACR2RB_22415 [Gammaproteobacteria bacterium]
MTELGMHADLAQDVLNCLAQRFGEPAFKLNAELEPDAAVGKLVDWIAAHIDLQGMAYTELHERSNLISDPDLPANMTFNKWRNASGPLFELQLSHHSDDAHGQLSFKFSHPRIRS